MSGPTDEEIAALLALPAEAREALKGCEGPGWYVNPEEPENVYLLLLDGPDEDTQHRQNAWLPCSPLEIVRVAGEKADHHRYLLCRDECERDGVWFVAECGYCDKSQEAGSPHLAALALLGEVWS